LNLNCSEEFCDLWIKRQRLCNLPSDFNPNSCFGIVCYLLSINGFVTKLKLREERTGSFLPFFVFKTGDEKKGLISIIVYFLFPRMAFLENNHSVGKLLYLVKYLLQAGKFS